MGIFHVFEIIQMVVNRAKHFFRTFHKALHFILPLGNLKSTLNNNLISTRSSQTLFGMDGCTIVLLVLLHNYVM